MRAPPEKRNGHSVTRRGLAYSIEPLKEIFLKSVTELIQNYNFRWGIYLDYEKEDFAALFGPNTVIHRPAKAGLPAASFFFPLH